MYLQYFWRVRTSEFTRISIQKSAKNVTAIQMWFWTAQIRENMKKWSRMVSNGGPRIHQKPVQHGNGKRGMRNQAQQQCIPSYSWACQTLPNDSKWVFTIPRLGWSFSSGTQNCNWVLLTAPKASTCSPAHSWVFLRVRKHLHGFLSIPKCAQAFSNIPETKSVLQICINIPIYF